MIYVIHVCLDVALMEKGICTPLWFLKNTHHPCTSQNILPNDWVKKSKTYWGSILDVPPRARPALAASVASVSVCFGSLCLWWHQFWSALAASEWRLTDAAVTAEPPNGGKGRGASTEERSGVKAEDLSVQEKRTTWLDNKGWEDEASLEGWGDEEKGIPS